MRCRTSALPRTGFKGTGTVEWLADGLPERLVARTAAAREHGLNAAFAVPIPSGDQIVAVVEQAVGITSKQVLSGLLAAQVETA